MAIKESVGSSSRRLRLKEHDISGARVPASAQLREGRLVSYYLLVKQRCSRKQKKGGEKCSRKRRVEIPEQCW